MKKLAKIFSVLASLALLGAGFVSCSSEEVEEGDTVIVKPSYKTQKTITVTGHKSDRIKCGNTEQLAAVVLPEDETVTWHSSDDSVITVSETGLVTANDVCDTKVQVWAQTADGTKSNEVNYLVMQEIPKITGISLVSAPAKEKYATGTPVNLNGMKVAVEYDVPVGTSFAADYPAEVEYSADNASMFEVSGFDSYSAVTGQTLTVTYKPVDTDGAEVEFVDGAVKTVTFDVDIISASVTSVTVNSQKSKTEYLYSNVLEPLDVALDIAYTVSELDETISATTNGVTMTVNGYDFEWSMVDASWFVTWTEEHKTGTSITFTYGGVSTSSPLDITFDAILAESVSISAAGSATTLESGSTLQFTAAVLPENATVNAMTNSVVWSVVDDDGTEVTIGSNGLLSAESAVASGKVKVKATANDAGAAVSSEIEITIPVWLKGISVTAQPEKIEYLTGDTLDSTGLEVTASYSDGTTAVLASDAYTLDVTTLSTAGTVPVTVTLNSDTSKTATFNVSVIQVYDHYVEFINTTADSWAENFAYSKIPVSGSDATKAVFDGSETGFEAYLNSHVWMQKGAAALVRTDKKALFLNRTSSTGEGAVTDQSPVLIATEVAGKYRIVVDLKATGKNNTGRTIYIKTLEENAASADGTTTQVTVPADAQMTTVLETTHGSDSQKVITYEYMGDSPYSIVGIGVPEGEAVYISKISIYTEQETLAEPEITIHASGVTIKDSKGSEITVPDGGSLRTVALKRGKTNVTYQLSAVITPAAAAEQTLSWSLSPESGYIILNSGLITVNPDISENYTGTITVTVDGTSVTDSIVLTVDASKRLLTAEDLPYVSTDNSQIATSTGTATLTAVFDETVLEEDVSFIWKKASSASGEYSDIEGATSKTYEFSSDADGSVYFRFVVTGAESGVTVASDAVSVYVGSKPAGGSITFDTTTVTAPTIVNNTVLKVTVTGSKKDYYPNKTKSSALKVNSDASVEFTTPGSTDLSYTLTVNYIATSAGSYKLEYEENGETKTFAVIDLPVAGSLGSTSSAAVIATAQAITVPGGTEFTLSRNAAETYLTGITIE